MVQPGPSTSHELWRARFWDEKDSCFVFHPWFFDSPVRVARDHLLPLFLIGGTVMVSYNPQRCRRQVGLPAGGVGLLPFQLPSHPLKTENMRMIDEARNAKGWWKVAVVVQSTVGEASGTV